VLATQNPIEQEGPIRFPKRSSIAFMLKCAWATRRATPEKEIVARMASAGRSKVTRVAEADDILAARSAIAELFMDQKVVDYIVDVVRGTANPRPIGLPGAEATHRFRGESRARRSTSRRRRAPTYLRGRSYVGRRT